MTLTITNMKQWIGGKIRIELEQDPGAHNFTPDASIILPAQLARQFTIGDRVELKLTPERVPGDV